MSIVIKNANIHHHLQPPIPIVRRCINSLILWEAQLSEAEHASLRQLSKVSGNAVSEKKPATVSEAVQWAEAYLFDRNSVVLEC